MTDIRKEWSATDSRPDPRNWEPGSGRFFEHADFKEEVDDVLAGNRFVF